MLPRDLGGLDGRARGLIMRRVACRACSGMDTLPHTGAVITLLAVTGLPHRQAYGDIFAITLTTTAAVFFVIGVYYLIGKAYSRRFGSMRRAVARWSSGDARDRPTRTRPAKHAAGAGHDPGG